jgi:predicted flap endonuclease-1-like 5' DNA nuclease
LLWFVQQSLVLLVLAYVVGLASGWLLFRRRAPTPAADAAVAGAADDHDTVGEAWDESWSEDGWFDEVAENEAYTEVAEHEAYTEVAEHEASTEVAEHDGAVGDRPQDEMVPADPPADLGSAGPDTDPFPPLRSDAGRRPAPRRGHGRLARRDHNHVTHDRPVPPPTLELPVVVEAAPPPAEDTLVETATDRAARGADRAEPVAPEPTAAEPVAAEPTAAACDDLTKIDGITADVAQALRTAGLGSYRHLSSATVGELRRALRDAGLQPTFKVAYWSLAASDLTEQAATEPVQEPGSAVATEPTEPSEPTEPTAPTEPTVGAPAVVDLTAVPDPPGAVAVDDVSSRSTFLLPAVDDLERIEGITLKIAGALRDVGIVTYADLAAAPHGWLRSALSAAGLRMAPTLATWGDQARMIVAGDEEGFAALRDRIAGGRETGVRL